MCAVVICDIVCVCGGSYALMSGFSGTSLFNSIALMLYNIVFTGFPVAFYALDKDVPDEMVMRFPQLYHDPQQSQYVCSHRVALLVFC